MLGVSVLRGNIHDQHTDSSVTVTQQYYDSVIETNGSKSEMVKVSIFSKTIFILHGIQ